MSHIRKITTPIGSTRYQARWLDLAGKQKSKNFALKRQAEQHLKMIISTMDQGTYTDPRAGKVTLSAYVAQWSAAQAWEESTRATKASTLKHLTAAFGARPIASIRPTEVQGWTSTITKKYARSTARGIVFAAFGVFAAAVRDRVIGVDPCEGVAAPAPVKSAIVIPTSEDVRRLYAVAPARYRAAVLLGAGAGLRQSEMTGLCVDRLVMPTGTPVLGVARGAEPVLTIDRQLACLARSAPYLKQPKTAAGIRTLPMASAVGTALTELLTAYPPSPQALAWQAPTGDPVTVSLLFTGEDGQPITRHAWSLIWDVIRTAAGLPELDFHELRHYAVSSLIRHGGTIKEVQAFAGHSNSRTTLDIYGHLWEDSANRTRSALNEALNFRKIQNQTDKSLTNSGS